MSVRVCVCVQACIDEYMYECMYVSLYVFMYVIMCMHVFNPQCGIVYADRHSPSHTRDTHSHSHRRDTYSRATRISFFSTFFFVFTHKERHTARQTRIHDEVDGVYVCVYT